jgi:hypothetical protein
MKKQSLKSLIVALIEYQLVICIVICPQTGTFGDYCPQVGTLGTAGLTFSIFFGQIKKIINPLLRSRVVAIAANGRCYEQWPT